MKDGKGKDGVEGKAKGVRGRGPEPVLPVLPEGISKPDLKWVPRRAGLLANRPNRLEVLVRIPCPPPPAGKGRPQLNLAFVLDRSGSMSGQPLEEAKRCVAAMVGLMGPQDRAALVVYDDHVQVVLPSTPVVSHATFRAALAGIGSGGMTNLHGGWLAGARQVADHLTDAGVGRVILLSDGNANQGVVDPAAIEDQVRALAAAHVSTSTYGLGVSFNEDLMVMMAKAGGGSGYFGETADHLMEPFRTEFDLMAALMGSRVSLKVRAAPWVKVRMRNDYVQAAPDTWLLPDLAWGGETWALLEIETPDPPPTLILGRDVHLVTLEASWSDEAGAPQRLGPVEVSVPLLLSGLEQLPEDPLVVQRSGELVAADFQRRAREAAGRGDWRAVDALLAEAGAAAADNPWVREVLEVLAGIAAQRDVLTFRKEAHYAAHSMSTRRTSAMEDEADFLRESEAARPSYLRRKTRQGQTQYEGDDTGSKDPSTKN
jgi:Ca-activated chloride channel family protein